jgi:hypothetical protein
MSLIGMREWQDISIQVDFRLPSAAASACIGSRVDQMWKDQGVVLCVGNSPAARGVWNLTIGGPLQGAKFDLSKLITTGKISHAIPLGVWHRLNLTTVGGQAWGRLGGATLFSAQVSMCMSIAIAIAACA